MHRYVTCGLHNIWLSNGYRYGDSPYGPTIAIADTPGLAKSIATFLAMRPGHLNDPELRFLRKHLDLTSCAGAPPLGVHAHRATADHLRQAILGHRLARTPRGAPTSAELAQREEFLVFRHDDQRGWERAAWISP